MRLIEAKTLKVVEFMDSKIPKYAILSHVWSLHEITFQDMQKLSPEERNFLASDLDTDEAANSNTQSSPETLDSGYAKIKYSCKRARHEKIDYVWIDTCCIDKTSSAELSEAINSMMRWYELSEVCYAYLADVPPLSDLDLERSLFSKSRWFDRGWTLQELIAPEKLFFLAQDWTTLFSRETVSSLVSRKTRIALSFLKERQQAMTSLRSSLSSVSIATRMSWASERKTSRQEDRAYSLLGIFGINMPLLYGEGTGAFIRLQEEIVKHSDDQSLFAWNWYEKDLDSSPDHSSSGWLSAYDSESSSENGSEDGSGWVSEHGSEDGLQYGSEHESEQNQLIHPLLPSFDTFKSRTFKNLSTCGILADSPAAFLNCGDYIPCSVGGQTPAYSITNKGLDMEIPLLSCADYSFILLQCQTRHHPTILLALPVKCIRENIYIRIQAPMYSAGHQSWSEWPRTHIYLLLNSDTITYDGDIPDYTVILGHTPPHLKLVGVTSRHQRNLDQMILMKGDISPMFNIRPAIVFLWFEDIRDNSQIALGLRLQVVFTLDTESYPYKTWSTGWGVGLTVFKSIALRIRFRTHSKSPQKTFLEDSSSA
ncbi:hypothetical protein N7454_011270 [Penicillium verhagenii]|nr:hypothetical protein N7454_011270 [Penicillium verhagenii]